MAVFATTSALAFLGTTATAAPRADYPAPVMTYVAHPDGFPDATEVLTSGGGLTCRVALAAATSGDVSVQVRSELAPLVQELMRQSETRYGYDLRKADTGAYNCRFIAGTTTPSNHAYGRAIDLNWQSNPQSSTFQSDLPPAVVSLWIRHGFYWGGHYTTSKFDTMHFEYVGARSAIEGYYASAVAEGGGPATPGGSCPSATLVSYPVLRQGDSGTAVSLAQCRLNASGAGLSADGAFGSDTAAATAAFQRARGLTADGIIGRGTWTALLAQGSAPTLSAGASGADVTRLQQALRASGQSVSIDGAFGPGTSAAVTAYQQRVGLSADGVVGAGTWAALQAGR